MAAKCVECESQKDDATLLGLLEEVYDRFTNRNQMRKTRTAGFFSQDLGWKEKKMPKVGKKTFPYTKAGKKAAKAASDKMEAKKMSKKMRGMMK